MRRGLTDPLRSRSRRRARSRFFRPIRPRSRAPSLRPSLAQGDGQSPRSASEPCGWPSPTKRPPRPIPITQRDPPGASTPPRFPPLEAFERRPSAEPNRRARAGIRKPFTGADIWRLIDKAQLAANQANCHKGLNARVCGRSLLPRISQDIPTIVLALASTPCRLIDRHRRERRNEACCASCRRTVPAEFY
jgi:hypothetical protein